MAANGMTEGAGTKSDSLSDTVFVYDGVIPFVTNGVTETEGVSAKTEPTDQTEKKSTLTQPDSELSVDVMAPQVTVRVTEFSDAYEVVLPSETVEAFSTEVKKPALVTGFSGTLPLALPVATPSVTEEPMAAFYVSTAYNLDFPSRSGLSGTDLIKELDAIVAFAEQSGMNTVVFQVRPASDALYASAIFPTSRYLAASEGGAVLLDVLSYLVKAAHARGIRVHAWINPFRVKSENEPMSVLSAKNPARIDPSLTFSVNGALYYNPALDEVHDLIVSGVEEIVQNYDVDGILFDDYFYPEGMGLADAQAYQAYQKKGGALSLGDFRRENINRLIRSVYFAIKKIRPSCKFGVSVRGIWRNFCDDPLGSDTLGGAAYDSIYCDALAWVRGGYIDYLSPQIYWSFDHAVAPFATLADWWNDTLSESSVTLSVSLASYSLSAEEIRAQKAYLEKNTAYGGVIYFRYSFLKR